MLSKKLFGIISSQTTLFIPISCLLQLGKHIVVSGDLLSLRVDIYQGTGNMKHCNHSAKARSADIFVRLTIIIERSKLCAQYIVRLRKQQQNGNLLIAIFVHNQCVRFARRLEYIGALLCVPIVLTTKRKMTKQIRRYDGILFSQNSERQTYYVVSCQPRLIICRTEKRTDSFCPLQIQSFLSTYHTISSHLFVSPPTLQC